MDPSRDLRIAVMSGCAAANFHGGRSFWESRRWSLTQMDTITIANLSQMDDFKGNSGTSSDIFNSYSQQQLSKTTHRKPSSKSWWAANSIRPNCLKYVEQKTLPTMFHFSRVRIKSTVIYRFGAETTFHLHKQVLRFAMTLLMTMLFRKVFLQVLLLRLIACEEDNGTADGIGIRFQNKMQFQVNSWANQLDRTCSIGTCKERGLTLDSVTLPNHEGNGDTNSPAVLGRHAKTKQKIINYHCV